MQPIPRSADGNSTHYPSQKKSKRLRLLFLALAIVFALIALASCGNIAAKRATNGRPEHTSLIASVSNWLQGLHAKDLTKEERLNILLLGQGGAGHDGPYLTDTIILLSIEPGTGDAVMLSIPRDLAIPVPDLGIRKINSINAIGEAQNPGNGAAFAADVVGKMLQLPIAAYIRIDFYGFEDLINLLGGITINVPRAFTDAQYPNDLNGVQTITFTQGRQTMDGATALMYARSRHGDNGEGSDFSRARRQQEVILAVRDKALNLTTLLSPGKLSSLVKSLNAHIDTNIPLGQLDDLLRIAHTTSSQPLTRQVLETGPDGILKEVFGNDGAYLLMPRDDRYETLALYVHNLLSSEDIRQERASLAILNGTNETGLARTAATDLSAYGASVTTSGNAPSRNWHENVIFEVSPGAHPKTLAFLMEKYSARLLTGTIPNEILEAAAAGILHTQGEASAIDIILILGK